ncbi:PstS family phosphate ABC transporter substrate-binding protein [Arachidicoccus sp.]|uniref:PstS family phosphate ABC transporter substrate-binding protein n=1 Tax=Arachidicoccus sp. TaxID=1872624 RepID=UPI003D20DE97
MQIKKIITRILLFSLTLYFVACKSDRQKSITISGAFALYPLGVKWTEQYKKLHPDARFDLSAGGAGKGLTDVLTGAADLAMFSRALTPSEQQKGIVLFAVAKDAVLPTFSAKNPLADLIHREGLTHDQLKNIYLSGKSITWGSVLDTIVNNNISVYTRSDAAGAADTWAAYFGGKQDNIKGTGIYGDPGLADAVTKDASGVGFNNVAFVYDISTGKKRPGIEVIPIDQNNNRIIDRQENFYDNADSVLAAIADGRYPSPPARDLYFLTKGKPTDPGVIAFLKWILTDGQQYVKAAGYVPLPAEKIQGQLDQLK